MVYKIEYFNIRVNEYYLGDKSFNTEEEAREYYRFTQYGLPRDVEFSKIVELNDKGCENEQAYDLTDDGKGKKYDSGKPMVGTLCRVFPRALLGIGQCITFGTKKYPKSDNWKLVDGAFTRYQDSMMRHYLKFLAGQEKDNETSLLHLKHMVWNALAVLELYLMEHEDETLFK
jgi:hypothetical protein